MFLYVQPQKGMSCVYQDIFMYIFSTWHILKVQTIVAHIYKSAKEKE